MISIKFIIWLTIIVGVVIFIHEFGHFIAGKLLGVKVEEFAFGFWRKVFSKKIGETMYRINIIPLGGYVKLLGQEEESDDPKSFSTKSFGARFLILFAGVFMNFVLAVLLFYVFLGFKGFEVYLPAMSDYQFVGSETELQVKPFVRNILEDTPASKVNFPKDVLIWDVDGEDVKRPDEFMQYLTDHEGEEITVGVIDLNGDERDIDVVPQKTGKDGVLLGIEFDGGVGAFYKIDYSKNKLGSGLLHSINFTGYNLVVLGNKIADSFREKSVKPVSEGVFGVVGLADAVLTIVKVGDILEIINLLAAINLSLAVANLLPLLPLDGGLIVLLIIEKIRGKKVGRKFEEWGIRIGFALLMLLVILVTVKDIIQFDIINRFINLIKTLF